MWRVLCISTGLRLMLETVFMHAGCTFEQGTSSLTHVIIPYVVIVTLGIPEHATCQAIPNNCLAPRVGTLGILTCDA